MKLGTYLSIDLPETAVWVENKTGKNLGHDIRLKYAMTDDNNIYFETPQYFDNPEEYTIINNDGQQMNLKQYLVNNGYYENYYAIISLNSYLSKIEHEYVEYCNSFYSIYINKEVADFFMQFKEEYLKEVFTYSPNFFESKLITYSHVNKERLTGYEILFFIDSIFDDVRQSLNELRLKAVQKKTEEITRRLIRDGITAFLNNDVCKFTATDKDIELFGLYYKYDDNILYNGSGAYSLNKHTVDTIYNTIRKHANRYETYRMAYLEYIAAVLDRNITLEMLQQMENMFIYGYKNEFIVKRIIELEQKENKNE